MAAFCRIFYFIFLFYPSYYLVFPKENHKTKVASSIENSTCQENEISFERGNSLSQILWKHEVFIFNFYHLFFVNGPANSSLSIYIHGWIGFWRRIRSIIYGKVRAWDAYICHPRAEPGGARGATIFSKSIILLYNLANIVRSVFANTTCPRRKIPNSLQMVIGTGESERQSATLLFYIIPSLFGNPGRDPEKQNSLKK